MNLYRMASLIEVIQGKIKENEHTRGYLTKLSEAIRIHPSYLTRTLQGTAQLSLDQVALMCDYWNFSETEAEYVLNLAIRDRATAKRLKSWSGSKLKALQEQNEDLTHKIKPERIAQTDHTSVYYTHWIYSAVHVALMVPHLRSVRALSTYFKMDAIFIEKVLAELAMADLVKKDENEWRVTSKELHISNQSPFAAPHHTAWRLRGLTELHLHKKTQYHFTGVYALSKKDWEKIISRLKDFISETHRGILKSKEEEVATICIDAFNL